MRQNSATSTSDRVLISKNILISKTLKATKKSNFLDPIELNNFQKMKYK